MRKTIFLIIICLLSIALLSCGQGRKSPGLPVIDHPYDPEATAGKSDSRFIEPKYPEIQDNSYDVPDLEKAAYELEIKREGIYGIVDLSTLFTTDVFSSCENPEDGMFDDVGSSFGSKGVSNRFVFEGVPYVLGSFADGDMNAVRCVGQTAKFSEAFTCDCLNLIVTTRNGDAIVTISAIYEDGTFTRTAIFAPDWCNRTASGRAYTVPHAHVFNGKDWETNDVRYLFRRKLDLDADKKIIGIQIGAANTVHLMSMTIEGIRY